MIVLRKRERYYHIDYPASPHRLRSSLGTGNRDAALRLKGRVENALAEGPQSALWVELKKTLPARTFTAFASYSGVRKHTAPTWADLQRVFNVWMAQRVQLGKLSPNTRARYEQTVKRFAEWATVRKMDELSEITKSAIETWKTDHLKEIRTHKVSRNGGGLILDVAVLHRVFAIGVEQEMLAKNPVKMEGKPGENPEGGAEPFNAGELKRLREHAAEDYLSFIVLRWTGLRGSDAVDLRWREVHFDRNEVERLTQKRKKVVIIPMHEELRATLQAEHDRRKPEPQETVLLAPFKRVAMTRPILYRRVVVLGKRAGVERATPHMFRDSLAVDLLLRGASLLDCARILGDEPETISHHYAPFVRELRDRVGKILNGPGGLEAV